MSTPQRYGTEGQTMPVLSDLMSQTLTPLLYSFAGLNLAQLSIGVLGVLVMTSEYSTGTMGRGQT